MINVFDANQRGIVDGYRVQVSNGRGAFKGVARITDDRDRRRDTRLLAAIE